MKPPRGGLRPLYNGSNDVAKVELRVPAGATVQAQDGVADQLLASGFSEGVAPAGLLDALDESHFARFPDDRPPKPVDKPPVKKAAGKL